MSPTEWSDAKPHGWPSQKPVYLISAVVLALATLVGVLVVQYKYQWTELQRVYLSPYVRSQVLPATSVRNDYFLLMVANGRDKRIALNTAVVPVEVEGPGGTQVTNLELSEEALRFGFRQLLWDRFQTDNGGMHAYLCHWIYQDRGLWDLVRPACWWGLGTLIVGIVLAVPKERKRRQVWRHGLRERGPELVTREEFNRKRHSDGIGFRTNERRTIRERLFRHEPVPMVRIPWQEENQHFLMMGDTGAGKSALIRQLLMQVQDRGETAIVYDPALEYTPQFYSPDRGDVILNPLDKRSPFWSPGDEVRHFAETTTVAASLFPDRAEEDGDKRFFLESTRKIFAHLLAYRPTVRELTYWMSHPEEIDKRVEGTELVSVIDPRAPEQRLGVLGSLSLVADSFRLLPAENEVEGRWSAAEWSQHRKGWVFITSTPSTRERLRPLISLWLDLLVLRLMERGECQQQKVWFVLDELASLQKLPQLHTALVENRKSNTPVVLGFQGRSQVEATYGKKAEAMLSQPATKIFLRTGEPNAAKWISETIGEVEVAILRESRSSSFQHQHATKSYALDRKVKLLVMASEITGLSNMKGYLKSGNYVVGISFPYMEMPPRHPGLIEREFPESGMLGPLAPPSGPLPQSSPKTGDQQQRRFFQ